MSFVDSAGWTAALADSTNGYETEAVTVAPDAAVTVLVPAETRPRPAEVTLDRLVLRYRHLVWSDGEVRSPERFALRWGGTYTIRVPRNAFLVALGAWVDSGAITTDLGERT